MRKRVDKLVQLGRLTTKRGPRGTTLVNIVALSRAIADESDPAQDLRNGRMVPATMPVDEDDDEDVVEPELSRPSEAPSSYHKSRAERALYQAENERLDLAERLNRLTDKDDVERRTMTAFRKVRDRLLAFPSTVADRVASAPDARAVKTLLAAEMRRMLEQLADELDHLDDDGDDLDNSDVLADG